MWGEEGRIKRARRGRGGKVKEGDEERGSEGYKDVRQEEEKE